GTMCPGGTPAPCATKTVPHPEPVERTQGVLAATRGAASLERAEEADDPGDLVDQAGDDEGDVEALVAPEHGDEAERHVTRRASGVLVAVPLEVLLPLDEGVDEVEEERRGQQAEEPLPPRHEIVFVAAVLRDVVREEQRREQVEDGQVGEQEGIDREGPVLDVEEPEFPPPEMHEGEQDRDDPADVHEIDLVAAGMVDEAGKAGEQAGVGGPKSDPQD